MQRLDFEEHQAFKTHWKESVPAVLAATASSKTPQTATPLPSHMGWPGLKKELDRRKRALYTLPCCWSYLSLKLGRLQRHPSPQSFEPREVSWGHFWGLGVTGGHPWTWGRGLHGLWSSWSSLFGSEEFLKEEERDLKCWTIGQEEGSPQRSLPMGCLQKWL